MKTLVLDGTAWRQDDDFYTAPFSVLNAPGWHGRNLDALIDSIVTGGIKQLEPPFHITIRGAARWPAELATFMRQVESVFHEAEAKGRAAKLTLVQQ